jgi:hypothetical protein
MTCKAWGRKRRPGCLPGPWLTVQNGCTEWQKCHVVHWRKKGGNGQKNDAISSLWRMSYSFLFFCISQIFHWWTFMIYTIRRYKESLWYLNY